MDFPWGNGKEGPETTNQENSRIFYSIAQKNALDNCPKAGLKKNLGLHFSSCSDIFHL